MCLREGHFVTLQGRSEPVRASLRIKRSADGEIWTVHLKLTTAALVPAKISIEKIHHPQYVI
jgi:hypothetical protein